MKKEIQLIYREIKRVEEIFSSVVGMVPSFDITNKKLLPYGLKAHTRSVSWIVEQVIVQQTKFNSQKIGIADVDIDMADTCLHDCVINETDGKRYFVNVKIHNVEGRDNKNDISAVEKLYMQYNANDDYRLVYACFGVKFDNLTIKIVKEKIHVFSPQFLPIYVNPRNDKIQAFYHHEIQERTRDEFLGLLRDNSRSIVLR